MAIKASLAPNVDQERPMNGFNNKKGTQSMKISQKLKEIVDWPEDVTASRWTVGIILMLVTMFALTYVGIRLDQWNGTLELPGLTGPWTSAFAWLGVMLGLVVMVFYWHNAGHLWRLISKRKPNAQSWPHLTEREQILADGLKFYADYDEQNWFEDSYQQEKQDKQDKRGDLDGMLITAEITGTSHPREVARNALAKAGIGPLG